MTWWQKYLVREYSYGESSKNTKKILKTKGSLFLLTFIYWKLILNFATFDPVLIYCDGKEFLTRVYKSRSLNKSFTLQIFWMQCWCGAVAVGHAIYQELETADFETKPVVLLLCYDCVLVRATQLWWKQGSKPTSLYSSSDHQRWDCQCVTLLW